MKKLGEKFGRFSLLLMQLALASVLILTFFSWAPWIDCRPVDELSVVTDQPIEIPPEASCFNVNHGEIQFSSRQPASADRVGFVLLSVFLAVCFGVLVWLNSLYRRKESSE
jgi:hypothetical protein